MVISISVALSKQKISSLASRKSSGIDTARIERRKNRGFRILDVGYQADDDSRHERRISRRTHQNMRRSQS
jgi:hypothetical protein